MGRFIVDIEADGLLDTVTKIHVVSWRSLDTGTSGHISDYGMMKRFFNQSNLTIIGHSFIRYDKPLVKLILGIDLQCRIIDSLVLSWYLEPNRPSHGLASYGEEYGIKKPEVEDWKGLPQKVYIHRCNEDVKINFRLFMGQLSKLKAIYGGDDKAIKRLIQYLCYKMECALEQEQIKWRLDLPKCNENLTKFSDEYDRKEVLLSSIMPESIEYKTLKRPKVFYKKDGEIGKLAENWLSLLDELGLDEETLSVQLEKNRGPGNPKSPAQLKDWLYSLGWEPVTFKYEKTEQGKTRRIPQVSLPRGEGLCPSVKLLYVAEPRLQELDMLYVLKHRVGILKGFLRDVDDEGYLQARVAGLTNTLRFKHSELVNLPGYTGKGDWRDGVHIRGVLIAPEGYVLCGSDMSSLEDRTKQHYMYYFDPEYVKSMQVPGFDPHLDLAEFGHDMTKGEMGMSHENVVWFKSIEKPKALPKPEYIMFISLKKVRSEFKTVNYGAVYGVGAPKMSLTTGMPLDQCTILLKAYWQKNWAVKEIAKACLTQEIDGQMWLHNPVSKFWYSLRYMKDRFSTLNQGTGVYAFDRWVKGCRDQGVKMCGQFHDEVVTPTLKGRENSTELVLRRSIENVNIELKLNRALDIDVQFGDNYAQIH
jgi:hypothetical protein